MEIVRAATELAGSVDAANTVRRSMRNLQLEPTPRDMLFGKASREELLSQLLTEAENPALASYAAAPRAVAFAPASARTLDLFTRESDEMFLRTPTPSERACVAGDMCEGIALGADGPLVERPSEATLSHQRRGTSNRCMCVVCLRHDGCYRVLNVRRELGYWPHEQSIVRYWSRAGMRGQYRIEDCFLPTTSPRILDLPIVIHIRSYYARETSLERAERLRTAPRDSPASRSDVVFLTQHGYLRPDRTTTLQDFEADFGYSGPDLDHCATQRRGHGSTPTAADAGPSPTPSDVARLVGGSALECGPADALSVELAHEAAIGEWLVPSLAAPLLASAPLSLPLQLARADPRLEFKKLLRRAYPTACTLRDFPTALRELRSPAAWHILRTIVACGLLGTLSWCCVRATAALRAAIHRRFAAGVGDLHAPDAFRDWALDNFALVRAALQERLFAVVADLPWLEQHFNICFNWTYLRNCARFCMDDVRRSMNAGSPPVPNTVLAWHDRTKPLAPRFRSAPAAKTVVSAFRKARVREIRLSTRARAKRWSADELRRELRNVVFEVRLSMFTERVAPRARLYEPALASSLASAAAYIARRPPITIVFPESFLPTRPLFPAYFCESENVLVRRYGKKHRVAVCEDIEHDRCACSHPLHAHAPTLASVRSRPDSHRACTFTGTDFLFFCGGCCEPRLVTSKQTFVRLEDACPICSPRARVLPKYPTPRGGRRGQRCSLCRAVSAHTKISFCGGRFVLVFFCARCVRAREPYVPTVHTR